MGVGALRDHAENDFVLCAGRDQLSGPVGAGTDAVRGG